MPDPDLTTMLPEDLAQLLANVPPESQRAAGIRAEFMRRQTIAQIQAAEAQERAAIAAESASRAAERSASYMLVYVAIAAATLIASILVPLLVHH